MGHSIPPLAPFPNRCETRDLGPWHVLRDEHSRVGLITASISAAKRSKSTGRPALASPGATNAIRNRRLNVMRAHGAPVPLLIRSRIGIRIERERATNSARRPTRSDAGSRAKPRNSRRGGAGGSLLPYRRELHRKPPRERRYAPPEFARDSNDATLEPPRIIAPRPYARMHAARREGDHTKLCEESACRTRDPCLSMVGPQDIGVKPGSPECPFRRLRATPAGHLSFRNTFVDLAEPRIPHSRWRDGLRNHGPSPVSTSAKNRGSQASSSRRAQAAKSTRRIGDEYLMNSGDGSEVMACSSEGRVTVRYARDRSSGRCRFNGVGEGKIGVFVDWRRAYAPLQT